MTPADLNGGVDWWMGDEANVARARLRAQLEPLRGHDLVCWCPLDVPCHGDVLLELANA